MIKRLIKADKKLVLTFAVSLFLTILFTFVFAGLRAYAASAPATSAADTVNDDADAAGDNTTGGSQNQNNSGYLDNPAQGVGTNPGASVLQQVIGVDASQPLEIIILMTLIALLPSILIMMTCFARIVIVMGFLRSAMQTQSTPPNMVITGMALFLTVFIMAPVLKEINEVAYEPYANEQITTKEAFDRAAVPEFSSRSLRAVMI